jgi:hypothetical protein
MAKKVHVVWYSHCYFIGIISITIGDLLYHLEYMHGEETIGHREVYIELPVRKLVLTKPYGGRWCCN